jgi:chaperonin GroES
MKFRPTHDRILVKRAEAESVTEGGLIIPENAKRQSDRGEVVAVGPGPFLKDSNKRRPIGLEPGQVVCFRRFSGEEIELDGVKHVILREEDIEGIVEG